MSRRGPLVVHPLLLGVFPVVFLYAHNIRQTESAAAVLPAVSAAAFALLVLLLCRLFLRDFRRAGLVASTFVVLFFLYGRACQFLRKCWPGHLMLIGVVTLAVCLLLVAVAFVLARKTKSDLATLTKLLNVLAVALLLVQGFLIAQYHVAGRHAKPGGLGLLTIDSLDLDGRFAGTPPDIYYIVMDRYAGPSTLSEIYGIDNQPFLDYLRSRGFFVAESSLCNYARTDLSLASSLNMGYVDGVLAGVGRARFMKEIYVKLQDNVVWRSLRRHGYRFAHFGSWWTPTSRNRFADINVNRTILGEFPMMLYKTTMLYVVGAALGFDSHKEQWLRVPYKFARLAEMPGLEGPTFVFAHFLLPHEAFVFGEDGRFISRVEQLTRTLERSYAEQLAYTNAKLRELIDRLLADSNQTPIIILQADEGPRPGDNFTPRRDPADTRVRFPILNAYLLPGVDSSGLYQSISPVNSFRVVLNHYVGAGLELLPDRCYEYREKRGELVDITDSVVRRPGDN